MEAIAIWLEAIAIRTESGRKGFRAAFPSRLDQIWSSSAGLLQESAASDPRRHLDRDGCEGVGVGKEEWKGR